MIAVQKHPFPSKYEDLSFEYEMLAQILSIHFQPRGRVVNWIGNYPVDIGIDEEKEIGALAILTPPKFWKIRDMQFPVFAKPEEKIIIDNFDEEDELDLEIYTDSTYSILYLKLFSERVRENENIQYHAMNNYFVLEINNYNKLTGIWIKGMEKLCFLKEGKNKKPLINLFTVRKKIVKLVTVKDLLIESSWEGIKRVVATWRYGKNNEIKKMELLYNQLKSQEILSEEHTNFLPVRIWWDIDMNEWKKLRKKQDRLYTWDTNLNCVFTYPIMKSDLKKGTKEEIIAQILLRLVSGRYSINEILQKDSL
jgi:hypothetical protein